MASTTATLACSHNRGRGVSAMTTNNELEVQRSSEADEAFLRLVIDYLETGLLHTQRTDPQRWHERVGKNLDQLR